jgi:hypothetical protein
MQQVEQQTKRTIDVTGLPEEAIRAVESLIAVLKTKSVQATFPSIVSPGEWSKALREWAESHSIDTTADDSRDSIYSDED